MRRSNGQNGEEKCLLLVACLLVACLLARFKGRYMYIYIYIYIYSFVYRSAIFGLPLTIPASTLSP